MPSSAFRPMTIVIMVLLLVGLSSYASGGARLDALADDGLLMVDVQADHMWPGSLADHGPAVTWSGWLARNERDARPHSGGVAGDYRHEIRQDFVGRVYWSNHPDQGSDSLNSVVQVGWKNEKVGLGLAWSRSIRDQSDRFGGTSHSTLALGIRYSLDDATLVDITLDHRNSISKWHPNRNSMGLRARLHRTIATWLTAVGAFERITHDSTRDLHNQVEAGLLIWPDPDLQILVSWVTGRVLYKHEEILYGNGDGLHVAAEARISSWLSWRSGVLVMWPGFEQNIAPVTRLGLGATLHVSHYDAVLGWSRHQYSDAPGLLSHKLDDSRLYLELTRWF